MKRIASALQKASSARRAYAVFVLCAATATALPAQTFTTLYNFTWSLGEPAAALVQATNGGLYGTTQYGGDGVNGADGTVFKITPGGTLTVYNFCSQGECTDGANPGYAALVQATNGDLYGTTVSGGAAGAHGTVFKMTPAGVLTTLHSFHGPDGYGTFAGLVQAANGDLYGTTPGGGVNVGGTVFKITPGGTLTTIYSFCSQSGCADGDEPIAGLVQAVNGDFYGTTYFGGVGGCGDGCGTVFRITPSGTLTTLVSFDGADGGNPMAGLVQATNGDFYGTTMLGGAYGQGTIFKITPGGTLTTLYSFCSQSGCADGAQPFAALVQATDGDFYGTTAAGGAASAACSSEVELGCGTIFKITPSGTLTTLYSFCPQSGCLDGIEPLAGLVQATNGNFYGTAALGGDSGGGTIFSLSMGLGPFVETQTTSGEAGAAVKILGSDLTGATSVTFNGTPATFTVVSRYLITTTVPAGATTGKVQVVTPSRTLSSNVPFRVP
jgi:uncharacterized repeat protein (TIGR03803 family)